MKDNMQTRYRLMRRGLRNGMFYCVYTVTRKRTSLQTTDGDKAKQIVEARNLAERQPAFNLQIAKAYLAASDANFVKRNWSQGMAEFVQVKTGKNRVRSERAVMDKAFDSIRNLELIETRPEHFLKVLSCGKVSTNNYLRRFHNFAVDMGWLPYPVMPKCQWPEIRYKEKRAITLDEHERILAREKNPDMRAFLKCCWHVGGSQSDMARQRLAGCLGFAIERNLDGTTEMPLFRFCRTGHRPILGI